jgi:hypothetical protein
MLPANVPQDLRDFVECRSSTVTITDGTQAWVTLPQEASAFLSRDTKPELHVAAGSTPDAATVNVKLGFISLALQASIVDGALRIDTRGLPMWAPASVGAGLQAFVDELNAWFKANGQGLAPPAFEEGRTSLTKVPLADR